MPRILIIEDDTNINEMIREALQASGYECVSAYSGTEGLLRMEQEEFQLILLDLMLPGLSGERVLEKGRKFTKAPFIVLSAKDSIDTKVDLLTLGADDYMTKPFAIKELKARIQVQLRKAQKNQESNLLTYKKLCLNKVSHDVLLEGEPLVLTQQEYKILELFLSHPDKVFTKQEIYEYAWDDYYIGEDRTINVHISNMRQKIKKITPKEYIETIWGIGFRLTK